MHDGLMIFDGLRFGEKIRQMIDTFAPDNDKFFNLYTIAKPMKLHVNTLRTLRFDSVAGNAGGDCVIDEDVCGGLGIAEVRQSFA